MRVHPPAGLHPGKAAPGGFDAGEQHERRLGSRDRDAGLPPHSISHGRSAQQLASVCTLRPARTSAPQRQPAPAPYVRCEAVAEEPQAMVGRRRRLADDEALSVGLTMSRDSQVTTSTRSDCPPSIVAQAVRVKRPHIEILYPRVRAKRRSAYPAIISRQASVVRQESGIPCSP